jgi:hypothetical protein
MQVVDGGGDAVGGADEQDAEGFGVGVEAIVDRYSWVDGFW